MLKGSPFGYIRRGVKKQNLYMFYERLNLINEEELNYETQ